MNNKYYGNSIRRSFDFIEIANNNSNKIHDKNGTLIGGRVNAIEERLNNKDENDNNNVKDKGEVSFNIIDLDEENDSNKANVINNKSISNKAHVIRQSLPAKIGNNNFTVSKQTISIDCNNNNENLLNRRKTMDINGITGDVCYVKNNNTNG
jgi:hypothetical protein